MNSLNIYNFSIKKKLMHMNKLKAFMPCNQVLVKLQKMSHMEIIDDFEDIIEEVEKFQPCHQLGQCVRLLKIALDEDTTERIMSCKAKLVQINLRVQPLQKNQGNHSLIPLERTKQIVKRVQERAKEKVIIKNVLRKKELQDTQTKQIEFDKMPKQGEPIKKSIEDLLRLKIDPEQCLLIEFKSKKDLNQFHQLINKEVIFCNFLGSNYYLVGPYVLKPKELWIQLENKEQQSEEQLKNYLPNFKEIMMQSIKNKSLDCRVLSKSLQLKIYNFYQAQFIEFMKGFDPQYSQHAFEAIQQFKSSKIKFGPPENVRSYCYWLLANVYLPQ